MTSDSNIPTGKRHPLNMRTTKRIRDLLHNAADKSGRSLAQEVEHRLEESFAHDVVVNMRDYFAAAALTGLIACGKHIGRNNQEYDKKTYGYILADQSYAAADAMLQARKS